MPVIPGFPQASRAWTTLPVTSPSLDYPACHQPATLPRLVYYPGVPCPAWCTLPCTALVYTVLVYATNTVMFELGNAGSGPETA